MQKLKITAIPVGELILDPSNVRSHGPESIEAIKGSLARFGQQKPIVVGPDGTVVAGNGTLVAARELGWKTIQAVRTDLEGAERVAFAIADNRTAEMSNWEPQALADAFRALDEAGLSEGTGFDSDSLKEALGWDKSEPGEDGEDPYTIKIEAPIYEPHADKAPAVSAVYKPDKARQLIKGVDAAFKRGEMEKDLAEMLRVAAMRHVEFDYEQIAELYAHSSPEVQRLMEDSILIVVDFDKAIEMGVVQVSEKLLSIAGKSAEIREEEE